jgi:hypothetical protein
MYRPAMHSVIPEQVFIVGMNGSGTTMLLDHIANHSLIYGFPNETKSFPYLITHQGRYGDLEVDENYMRLWRDIRNLVVGQPRFKPESIPTPDTGPRTAAGIIDHIMKHLASAQGKEIWCEKTPMHVHHLKLLAQAFPTAKFIHVIRDGRDCAASFHRRWRYNPVRTMFRWKLAVSTGMQHGRALGSRYHEVRYEEITASPEAVFRDVLGFLGVPYEAAVLVSSRSRTDATASRETKVTRNLRRASDYFSPATIARMESVAGRLLTELGYRCANVDGNCHPGRWHLRLWQFTDEVRRFATMMLMEGRVVRPRTWRYVIGRLRNALKQKSTL